MQGVGVEPGRHRNRRSNRARTRRRYGFGADLWFCHPAAGLAQPTAGDTAILPMVNSGEVDFGNGNAFELHNAYEGAGPGGKMTNLRAIAAIHTLYLAFWVRKDAPMQSIGDLRGKRVAMGYS